MATSDNNDENLSNLNRYCLNGSWIHSVTPEPSYFTAVVSLKNNNPINKPIRKLYIPVFTMIFSKVPPPLPIKER